MPVGVPGGLNLGAIKQNPPAMGKMGVPGLNIGGGPAKVPVQIPSLGAPGLAGIQRDSNSDNNTSGRQSSKRHGIGSLNLSKAVAI
jgi:hypothetical protein